MPKKLGRLVLAFSLISISSRGQISGVIKDGATGKPIKEATVFVNGSTLSTLTSKEGTFDINNIPIGFCQLIVYKHGYQLFKSSVNISQGKSFRLNLDLVAQTAADLSKKFSSDDRKLELLRLDLFGSSQSFKIANPKSIRFSENDSFILVDPLIIENPTLGYYVYCYVSLTEKGAPLNQVLENVRFEQSQTKELKVFQQWESERMKSYWGSPRHFLKSLISGSTAGEGFKVFDSNHIPLNIGALFEKSRIPNYYRINLTNPVEVFYDQKRWILHPNGRIDATADGLLMSQSSINLQDETSSKRIAELLPIDYDPLPNSSVSTVRKFQERIYFQTDKPYYYPRETIWMKGYLNYERPQLRDSLSSTAYVEFVSDQKKILFSKMVKIENGVFTTDISLPDSIHAGDYNIRAYTNFMRNFSGDAIFSKYVRVLKLFEWVDLNSPAILESESSGLVFTSDKPVYKVRDKVTLTIAFSDSTLGVSANLSVAVTDIQQVRPAEQLTILSPSFQINKTQKVSKEGLKYPLEHGVGIAGRFYSGDNVRPDKTSITVILGKLDNMKRVDTDAFGRFSVDGLSFYDTVGCSFQALDKYGNLYGRVVLAPMTSPEVNFTKPAPDEELKIEQGSHKQRILSEYELPKNTILLKEVNVTAKKIDAEKMEWGRRMFTPDRVIYAKELTMVGNIVQSMERKLVGFGIQFDPNNGTYTIYNFRSLPNSPPPAILIDGTPSTIEMLNLLPPENVDRIETSSGVQNIYGITYNGVVAIYTKNYSNSDKSNRIQVVKIKGYSHPNDFRAPDYAVSKVSTSRDLRSTIYWNPNISLKANNEPSSVSFFTSDQHGTYRVVIEGMASDGRVLRATGYVRVEK